MTVGHAVSAVDRDNTMLLTSLVLYSARIQGVTGILTLYSGFAIGNAHIPFSLSTHTQLYDTTHFMNLI